MNSRSRIVSLLLCLPVLACAAGFVHAGPRDAVTVTRPPEGQGAAFVPGTRLVAELPKHEYVEEEFFVEGKATLYNYAHNPPLGHDDLVPLRPDVPYRTRLILRRPADPAAFNGTVVVEWWNSTAGFDTAPAWDPSAAYFARRGIVYVGVTNSATSINFLAGGCRVFGVLPPSCGTRYSTLSLPENGLAYEMMSQIANLLRSNVAQNPLPWEYRVKRLFHVGESQQGGSVITYANSFHLAGVNSGYFIQSMINARPINAGPRCGETNVPAFPDCTPRLERPVVRTDLPVPVYQVITQTDFETLGFNVAGRQPDTKFYRYYEVAGGAHNVVHSNVEIVPAGLLAPGPIMLDDLCANEINSTGDGPVYVSHVINALWTRMTRQVRHGKKPPAGVVMDQSGGVLQRDALGNVTGGVRVPAMAVPVARYDSTNVADPALPAALQGIGNLACRLSGSVFPFDAATLDSLYPAHENYVRLVRRSVAALQGQGLLLRSDAADIVREAERSSVGN